jgi:hypothetical protein
MTIEEAIEARHSVRSYTDKSLEEKQKQELTAFIDKCRKQSGLNIQLVTEEPKAFSSILAHYGNFSGVRNYIVLAGKKDRDLEEKTGYYGEKIVLKAQQLGLNTCWTALTFSKTTARKFCSISADEKLICAIALGFGKTQGAPRTSKDIAALCTYEGQMPDWFEQGVKAAMLAPTALNQQNFLLIGKDNTVCAKNLGGLCSKIDLGIVKCHFELGAGKENFVWEN